MSLYKYCRYSENLLGVLVKKHIWLSGAKKFNDIFDCQFRRDQFTKEQLSELKAIHEYRKSIKGKIPISMVNGNFSDEEFDLEVEKVFKNIEGFISDMGIMSLSEINDSLLLWGHYASNHEGVCIEYDVPLKSNGYLMPVNYSTQYPKLSIYDFAVDIAKATDAILSTKSMEWAYEKEWRYVETSSANKEIPAPFEISAIIFGARMPDEQSETIKAITAGRGIKYKKAKQSLNSFSLEIVDLDG